MRSDPPPLMPIFRSRQQADLLTRLFLLPDQDHTATALSTLLGLPLTSVHRELQRLEQSGLVIGRQVGRSRLLRADLSHPAAEALTHLLLVTFGPQIVIGEEFSDLTHVSQVLVYGSWAARYHGLPGGPPSDVDVLVIGTPVRTKVYAAAEHSEERLGIPVNPTIRTLSRWESGDDPLVRSIQAHPIVEVEIIHSADPDDEIYAATESARSA